MTRLFQFVDKSGGRWVIHDAMECLAWLDLSKLLNKSVEQIKEDGIKVEESRIIQNSEAK